MPGRKGLLAPQNTFLDTIATRFDGTHSNFVLGNAQVPNAYPIVYCSDGFCELTGFSRAQIMQKGCACKFLYGAETDEDNKKQIEKALAEKAELKAEVKFYKKNGGMFWCLLDIVPIKNEKRDVVLFLASHKDITSTKQFSGVNRLPLPGSDVGIGLGGHFDGNNGPLLKVERGIGFDHDAVEDSDGDIEANNGLEAPSNYNYGRRRSRAVLYQLSGHYKTDKAKKIHSKLSTNSLLSPPATNIQPLPEYKSTVAKKPRWVLSHYGMVKTCWDFMVLLATIYVAIVVPYNAAFHEPETETCDAKVHSDVHLLGTTFVDTANKNASETSHDLNVLNGVSSNGESVVKRHSNVSDGSYTNFSSFHEEEEEQEHERRKASHLELDIIVEAIFILDIILNFRTTFVNKKGEVVASSRSIAFHYLKGWFLLDLVAAIPFDLILSSDISSLDSDTFTSIHLLKLTRLLRLARLLQKMDRYSQYSIVILTLLMMTFALLAHWTACLWYVIGRAEQPIYRTQADLMWPGWLNLLAQRLGLPNGGCIPHSVAYVTALYYTCTSLTTVGFGNVSANTMGEKTFSVVIMLIGALMHATIFGNVTALVQRMYGARKSVYSSKWRDLKDFTILHSVPKHLKQRMQDYFQTMWSLNHGIDPIEILNDYPEELRGDVSLHLHKEILSLPIFETASEGCRKLLSLKIKTNFCAPDEFLIHKGDALQNIFYLYNGSMEVLQNGMVVAILGKGDLVGCDISKHLTASKDSTVCATTSSSGEVVIVKSSCDVRALTYCDLKCLHIPGLVEVLRLYPEFKDQFAEDILHDLTFNLREGWEADYNFDDDIPTTPSQSKPRPPLKRQESAESPEGGPNDNSMASTSTKSVSMADDDNNALQISSVAADLRKTLGHIEQMMSKESSNSLSSSSHNCKKSNRAIQTDFPAAMLEDYVIKNRKRILKLLGLSGQANNSDNSGASSKSDENPRLHCSWNPLPSLDQQQQPAQPFPIENSPSSNAQKSSSSSVKKKRQKMKDMSPSNSASSKGNNASNGNGGVPCRVRNINETTPLISIDICSDENLSEKFNADNEVIVNYPGAKRHSTGDASAEAAAFVVSGSLNAPNPPPRNSTVSLVDVGVKSRSGSRTAITDF